MSWTVVVSACSCADTSVNCVLSSAGSCIHRHYMLTAGRLPLSCRVLDPASTDTADEGQVFAAYVCVESVWRALIPRLLQNIADDWRMIQTTAGRRYQTVGVSFWRKRVLPFVVLFVINEAAENLRCFESCQHITFRFWSQFLHTSSHSLTFPKDARYHCDMTVFL